MSAQIVMDEVTKTKTVTENAVRWREGKVGWVLVDVYTRRLKGKFGMLFQIGSKHGRGLVSGNL